MYWYDFNPGGFETVSLTTNRAKLLKYDFNPGGFETRSTPFVVFWVISTTSTQVGLKHYTLKYNETFSAPYDFNPGGFETDTMRMDE